MLIWQIFNAVFQVILFSVIPWIWWFVTARKKVGFFSWIGLKKPNCHEKKKLLMGMAATFAVSFLVGELAVWLKGDIAATESIYRGMGIAALPSVLVYSYIQTGLSEEILFRGFLLKRLAAKFGFLTANIIQALIFGTIHLLMVWGQVNILSGAVIVIYPMIPAVLIAVLNEKKAGGSILPGWLIHGTMNTVSALLSLF